MIDTSEFLEPQDKKKANDSFFEEKNIDYDSILNEKPSSLDDKDDDNQSTLLFDDELGLNSYCTNEHY